MEPGLGVLLKKEEGNEGSLSFGCILLKHESWFFTRSESATSSEMPLQVKIKKARLNCDTPGFAVFIWLLRLSTPSESCTLHCSFVWFSCR